MSKRKPKGTPPGPPKNEEITRLADLLGMDRKCASHRGLARLKSMLSKPQRQAERARELALQREQRKQANREAADREKVAREERLMDKRPPQEISRMMYLAEVMALAEKAQRRA